MKQPALWIAAPLSTVGFGMASFAHESPQLSSFAADVSFLRQYAPVIVLRDSTGSGQVAVVPAWQGRVATSSAQAEQGASFGWLNRKLIASREVLPHFNPVGGEDRVWLGPEGGQFSIYFKKDAPFDLEHWYVPKAFDTQPFQLIKQTRGSASFQASFELTNYSGTHFEVRLERGIDVLEPHVMWKVLKIPAPPGLQTVAYDSRNRLINRGTAAWTKDSGLVSLWILGMFNPSPTATIVIPINDGPDERLGQAVTSDYFGAIPSSRLKVAAGHIFLKADGLYRSKVGVNPKRSRGVLGAYDSAQHVLTLVQFEPPSGVTDYVNSQWKVQENPYGGDALNGYNDGAPAPGVPPMGPFYELESSSPAAALAPGQSLEHVHRTVHLTGSESALDVVARSVLGVSLAEIQAVFNTMPTHAQP